jgi:hypothetical protein
MAGLKRGPGGLGFGAGLVLGVVGVWAFHKYGHSIGTGKGQG